MKRQTRFYSSPLRHAINAVKEAGTRAAKTPTIPQTEELYTASRALSISSGSFPSSDEEQTVTRRNFSAGKPREPVVKPKMTPKNKKNKLISSFKSF